MLTIRGGVVVVVALVATLVRPSGAQTPPSIDASTLRVFAVGTVGVENISLPDGTNVAIAEASSGHGTGFVVEPGLVMTAHHVVDGARHVVVRLPGEGGFFPARVIHGNKSQDVAILAVEGTLPPALTIIAEPPRVRTTVFAVGYPVDATRKQPQSARGIIAGHLDDGTVQLDMALNPGNSGGPVVNEQDQVVGMAIARGAVEHGVQGIGYAVPVGLLRAALDEAKRRLASGEVSAVGMSRESATVVDELVQHGALFELQREQRKPVTLSTLPEADLDKALAGVTARIQDADLLVFVASAMWNVSVALLYVEPSKLKLTYEQSRTLSARLRESSQRAVRRAVQLDGSVGGRSSFVALATAANDHVAAPSMTPEIQPSAAHAARPPLFVQAAPIVRYNETTGSTGWGAGASVGALLGADREIRPLLGLAFGSVRVSTDTGSFAHTLIAAQAGVLARWDKVDLAAMVEACVYMSSVFSADMPPFDTSESTFAMSARLSLGYRVGSVVVGAGARVLGGPTAWLEPLSLAVHF